VHINSRTAISRKVCICWIYPLVVNRIFGKFLRGRVGGVYPSNFFVFVLFLLFHLSISRMWTSLRRERSREKRKKRREFRAAEKISTMSRSIRLSLSLFSFSLLLLSSPSLSPSLSFSPSLSLLLSFPLTCADSVPHYIRRAGSIV